MLFSVAQYINLMWHSVKPCQVIFIVVLYFRYFLAFWASKNSFLNFFGAQTNLKNIPASFGGSEENTQYYSTSREGYSNTYRLQTNTQNEPSLLFTNNFKFQDWIRSFQNPQCLKVIMHFLPQMKRFEGT